MSQLVCVCAVLQQYSTSVCFVCHLWRMRELFVNDIVLVYWRLWSLWLAYLCNRIIPYMKLQCVCVSVPVVSLLQHRRTLVDRRLVYLSDLCSILCSLPTIVVVIFVYYVRNGIKSHDIVRCRPVFRTSRSSKPNSPIVTRNWAWPFLVCIKL